MDASRPVFPVALAGSLDPVEDFVASSTVLGERTVSDGKGRWDRRQLVRESGGTALFLVDELWCSGRSGNALRLASREIFSANRIMVRSAAGTDEADLATALHARGMRISSAVTPDVFVVEFAPAGLDAVDRALASVSDLVEHAERDGLGFGAAAVPNDPQFPNQWNLRNTGQSGGKSGVDIGVLGLWSRLGAKTNVSIAVLDTGLRFGHPDFKGLNATGRDFVNKDADPSDDNGHGTGVTGVMLARRSNSIGVAGILPGARLIVVKVLDKQKKGLTSQLIAGLSYARTNGAAVMNLSLVGYTPPGANTNEDTLLARELALCESAEIVLCVSAGNKGSDNDKLPDYPSCYTNANIVAVGNHDRFGRRWSGTENPSNYGAKNVDVFAPGREIVSADLARSYGDYSMWTGTSVATPHVAAVAAAVKMVRPLWSAHDVKAAVLNSVVRSTDLSNLCLSRGRLAASNAINFALLRPPRSQRIPPFARTNNVRVGTVLTFTNKATTAGLPVVFKVLSGPATIASNRATITAPGTVVVRASQAGNTNVNPAPMLTNVFSAVKAP